MFINIKKKHYRACVPTPPDKFSTFPNGGKPYLSGGGSWGGLPFSRRKTHLMVRYVVNTAKFPPAALQKSKKYHAYSGKKKIFSHAALKPTEKYILVA